MLNTQTLEQSASHKDNPSESRKAPSTRGEQRTALQVSYFCPAMEDWELDFGWLEVRTRIKESLSHDALPNMNAILLLIGVQELGQIRTTFTKEEKQDLMHIAVCHLLSLEGYYSFAGRDIDGWPHYEQVRIHDTTGLKTQEDWLKRLIIRYFRESQSEMS